MGRLDSLRQASNSTQQAIHFHTETRNRRGKVLHLVAHLPVQCRKAHLRLADYLEDICPLQVSAFLIGIAHPIFEAGLQSTEVCIQGFLCLLQTVDPGLHVAISLGGILLSYLVLHRGHTSQNLFKRVFSTTNLCGLSLLCLLCGSCRETILLLHGLHLLLNLPVPLLGSFRPTGARPEPLVQAINTASKRLGLLNEAIHTSLHFGPAFPAVMLVSTVVQLGLQFLFQLCQATPVNLTLTLQT
mmetsp:Transcript_136734/g.323983  ORF Transcript_136734/g.323983 Transcript_136734/m.323983 type:complete len:243 (+) Transcript_136734:309-1037(+)